jgi:hypothetical protein
MTDIKVHEEARRREGEAFASALFLISNLSNPP